MSVTSGIRNPEYVSRTLLPDWRSVHTSRMLCLSSFRQLSTVMWITSR